MSYILAKSLTNRFSLLAALIIIGFTAYFYPSNERTPSRTIELTYTFTISDISSEATDIHVWVPLPLTNNHQKLESLNVFGDWLYEKVEEDEYGNKFLNFDLSNLRASGANNATISINYIIVRYTSYPLKEKRTRVFAGPENLARFLAPDRLIPINGIIAAEAEQTAGDVDTAFNRARMLYDHIVETVVYDKSGTGWGRGDAIYACDVRKGNCTDFHSLFIGEARALNIPAKFIMGVSLPEDKSEGVIPGYHCWGEFYVSQNGWLPIDASEASKFPEKKDVYFARLDEHRIAFTIGRDIKLPGSDSEPLNYSIFPHVEVDGQTYNNVETSFFFKDIKRD